MNFYAWQGQVACLITILSIIVGVYLGRRRLGIGRAAFAQPSIDADPAEPLAPAPELPPHMPPHMGLVPGVLLSLAAALALAIITPRDQALMSTLLALTSGLMVQMAPRLISSSALAALLGLTLPTCAWFYLTTTIPPGFASGEVSDANRLAAELSRWPLTLLAPVAAGALASFLTIALHPAALFSAGRSSQAPLADAQPRTLVALGMVAGVITPLIALTCAMHAGRMMQLGFEAPTTDRFLLILAASESAAFAIAACGIVLALSQIAGVPSLAFTAIGCLAGGILARMVLPTSFPSDVEVRYKDLLIDIIPRLVSILGAMLVIGAWLGGPRRVPAFLLMLGIPLALGFAGTFNSKLPWHWTFLTAMAAVALVPLLVAAAQQVSRSSDPSELTRPPITLPRLLPPMYLSLAVAAVAAGIVSLLGSQLPAALSLAELDWHTRALTPAEWFGSWSANAASSGGPAASAGDLWRGLLAGIIIAFIATSVALVLLRNLAGSVMQSADSGTSGSSPSAVQMLPAWAVIILCLLPVMLVIALQFVITSTLVHHAASVSLSLASCAMLIVVAAAPPPPSITQPPLATLALQAVMPTAAQKPAGPPSPAQQSWPAIGLIALSLSLAAIILTAS